MSSCCGPDGSCDTTLGESSTATATDVAAPVPMSIELHDATISAALDYAGYALTGRD
ncbi:hypothetical protein ACFTWH_30410 [Streptomyces sp. NPDC057011]|uniref:hypothetical protein n=1 Tax=unclassified Streptomyces TaxID=2593676 RepID=UPI0036269BD9